MDIAKYYSGSRLRQSAGLSGLALVSILVLHCMLQWQHLRLDYWNDELYTLQHFVFRPLAEIIQDYHVPNNHVFFSLLLHAAVRIVGLHSMQDAIANPVCVRSVLLGISLFTILATYRLTALIGGRAAALLSVLLLVTTIPFYNYAVQVRGYTLSMCLYACLAWAVVYSCKHLTIAGIATVSVLAALSLYTLPSNVYFTIAAAVALLTAWLIHRNSNHHYFPTRTMLAIQAALLIGVGLAFLFYLPVSSQIAGIPSYHTRAPETRSLIHTMPIVAYHFLSARYLLLVLLALGVFAFLRRQPSERTSGITTAVVSTVVFVVPFALSDIRQDNAPYRIFLTGLPVLMSGIALIMVRPLTWVDNRKIRYLSGGVVAAYCLFVCIGQIRKTERQALKDIDNGTRAGDLYFQYNLHFYHPRRDAQDYLSQYSSAQIPLVEACRSDAEILKYLRLSGRYNPGSLNMAAALNHYKTVDVLIENPASLKDSLLVLGDIKCKQQQLLPGPRNVQFIRLTTTVPRP